MTSLIDRHSQSAHAQCCNFWCCETSNKEHNGSDIFVDDLTSTGRSECAIIINTRPMYPIFDGIESLICARIEKRESKAKRRLATQIPMESKRFRFFCQCADFYFFWCMRRMSNKRQLKSIFRVGSCDDNSIEFGGSNDCQLVWG